jgi:hypothetical protein
LSHTVGTTEIHINYGPRIAYRVQSPDDRSSRWCFGCRQHLPHFWELAVPEQGAMYDPVAQLRCHRCLEDRASFPGAGYDGPRPVPEEVADRLVSALESVR